MNQTENMSVDPNGIAFLVNKLGNDCPPTQQIRELTKNAIEAIEKRARITGHEFQGRIDWGVDPVVRTKLSIVDNGCGMTEMELSKYINQLSSSGGIQAADKNFGMGAKIAASTRNPAGLYYTSTTGPGAPLHHCILWRDPDRGYGLQLQEDGKRVGTLMKEAAFELFPDWFDGYGTRVTLHGESEEANTLVPLDGSSSSRWLSSYLNGKFYRFPDGLTVRAMDFTSDSRETASYRQIYGMEYHLNSACESKGVVDLSNAKARWWILRQVDPGEGWHQKGHVAAIYQDELYCRYYGKAASHKLHQFGIVYATAKVVIYIEPALANMEPDISRSTLKVNGSELPWEEWAEEFREQLPEEIKAMQEREGGNTNDDLQSSLFDKMKTLLSLFQETIYVQKDSGEFRADLASQTFPKKEYGERDEDPEKKPSKKKKKKRKSAYAKFLKENGSDSVEESKGVTFPEAKWIDEPDDDLKDHAATYILQTNQLLINSVFPPYKEWLKVVARKVEGDGDAALRECQAKSKVWYALALQEAIMGVKAMERMGWSEEKIEKALENEALTAVAMQRYHQTSKIQKELVGMGFRLKD